MQYYHVIDDRKQSYEYLCIIFFCDVSVRYVHIIIIIPNNVINVDH